MDRWVEIEFDCLPLRSVPRWDVPLDASPKYQEFCTRLKEAAAKHGTHNVYYLLNARCKYHLTNRAELGTLEFSFEGVVLTDNDDRRATSSELAVRLLSETCPWLTEPIVRWFADTVARAVEVEFDRYIEAGDLKQTQQRIEQLQAASDQADGFLGMYL